MKRLILIVLIICLCVFVLVCLIGCVPDAPDLYNMNDFILPNDMAFINVVKELQSARQICQYIHDNFTYKAHLFYGLSPYELYLTKEGDCNDFSTFAVFILTFHDKTAYQIRIFCKHLSTTHYITAFYNGDKLEYIDNWSYLEIAADSFEEIVKDACLIRKWDWKKYVVYNYNMEIVEMKKKAK